MIFDKLTKGYNWAEEHMLVIALAVMVAITFTQVIFRYVFNNALSWSEEVARYIFIWISWLGVSTGVRNDAHIKVMLLPDLLKKKTLYKTEICLRALVLILWLFTTILVSYYGIGVIEKQMALNAVTPAVQMPVWIVYICIPFCGIIIGIRLAACLVKTVKELFSKPNEGQEVSVE